MLYHYAIKYEIWVRHFGIESARFSPDFLENKIYENNLINLILIVLYVMFTKNLSHLKQAIPYRDFELKKELHVSYKKI